MRRTILTVAVFIFIIAGLSVARQISHSNQVIQLKNVQLEDTSARLKVLQLQYVQLNKNLSTELQQKNQDQQKVQQLEQEKNDLTKQLDQAQSLLQARAAGIGNPQAVALLEASGIPSSQWASVNYIVTHESGWQIDATNSSSGAHGLIQALPYSKTGCGWNDAVCQLKWASTYAVARYGGWGNAASYWANNHNW